jgi:hypothetical protein
MIKDERIKKYLPLFLLALLIALLSAYMVYWATEKIGFDGDEFLSLMDIRGSGLGRPYREPGFFNVWHNSAYFESSIGVTAENAFTFNLPRCHSRDIPFYFVILHITYSFYPGVFSIWPAIVLNILLFAGTLVLLYALSFMLIKDKYLALLPVLIWGVSTAAIDLVVFIRHYMLFTFICVLITYIVFRAVMDGHFKWKHMAILLVASIAGMMTHQFLIIYAFILSVFICLYLIIQKDIKSLIRYSSTMFLAVIGNEFIGSPVWGSWQSRRRRETIENVIRIFGFERSDSPADYTGITDTAASEYTGFMNILTQYSALMRRTVFADTNLWVIIALVVLIVVLVLISGKKKMPDIITFLRKKETVLLIILGATCILHILAVTLTNQGARFRYISNVTPFIILFYVSIFIIGFRNIFSSKLAVFLLISVPCTVLMVLNINAKMLHLSHAGRAEMLEPYHNAPVVVVGYPVNMYRHLLSLEDEMLITTAEIIDMELIREKSYDNGMILFFPGERGYTGDLTVDDILAESGLSHKTRLMQQYRHNVYYLE